VVGAADFNRKTGRTENRKKAEGGIRQELHEGHEWGRLFLLMFFM
jgi:hypothetical protein